MNYKLKKISRIIIHIFLIIFVCIHFNSYSKNCKKNQKMNKIIFSNSDSSNSFSPFPIYHDLGISKEDSMKMKAIAYKQDLSYYLYLKTRNNPTQEFIDSLFETGYKIDLEEYLKLKKIVEKEVREKRDLKK